MIIYGRNPVREVFRAGKTVEKLYLVKGEQDMQLSTVFSLAKDNKVPVSYIDRRAMEQLAEGGNHQGVAAQITDFEYSTVDDMRALAKERGEGLLILLLDGITDPHNLGAIIRSAECFGAHGVVIPRHRSVSVNDTVVKVASGATEHLAVAKVTNINDTIRELKSQNVWVYACDFDGQPPKCVDMRSDVALVIGSEGSGIKRLTKELCDGTVTIPEYGRINSLNASVAAGVVLYEAARQRHE